MRIPKIYGQSKTDTCPFCEKRALTENSQGIPVCIDHKKEQFPELKCACGCWLDLKNGKFGPFFVCENCGIVNMRKAREMNPGFKPGESSEKPKQVSMPKKRHYKAEKETKKEITVTSDEVDFL
ncbi:MAG: hypothetical protein KKG59_03540 [Nanoarchaeota archaeon]|nr:hypothetical protein [Nanoarchaeota archaeon]